MFTLILLRILLFAGGFGNWYLVSIGGFLGAVALLLINTRNSKFRLPPKFKLYILFLILFFANLFLSFDKDETLKFLLLFVSGGAFWILAYNLGKKLEGKFEKILIFLGLIFGLFYLIYTLFGLTPPAWGVFSFTSYERTHNHIGDLWALVLLVPIYKFLKGEKNKLINYIVLGLGLTFLAASLSRSAYVSLMVGISFISWKLNVWGKYKKFLLFLLGTLAILFISASLLKPTVGNRIYYLQSILGLYYYPLGVGVGNFSQISSQFSYSLPLLRPFSAYVHNIALEVLSGMGILGLVFIYWLYKVVRDVIFHPSPLLASAIFLALFANFFFDRTYITPTMLWLWFISLGLAQKRA